MSHYRKHFNPRSTSQRQPIPNSAQIQNNAGGYAWKIDPWQQLTRFLVLGTEGGTYYVSEQKLTVDNANAVIRCLDEDGVRVVNHIVEISESGRAAKNDPALFALALAASHNDLKTRRSALDALPSVARTGTHLFQFISYVEMFRGWGRALREGVARWYTEKSVDDLAYQMIKYRQRHGWTHADVLRKSHPIAVTSDQNALFKWAVDGDPVDVRRIEGFIRLQEATTGQEVAELIREYNMPREAVPTNFLKDREVWEALLEKMPLTAMIRNLGKMGSVGLLVPGAWDAVDTVTQRLTDIHYIQRSRVHPIQALAASITYGNGHGVRGSLTWDVVPQVVDSLEQTFYASFGNVEPTGKRFMLGLDVSGSMSWGDVSGVPGLTPRQASAAMAMVTARTENKYVFTAFSHELVDCPITANMSLNDVENVIDNIRMGGTDCALPMIYALDNGLEIDVFVIYTDSETWYGNIHPAQAIQKYRKVTGIPAKLVVVGMESNGFSIADPDDPGMLDVVGFDTATPSAIAEFTKL